MPSNLPLDDSHAAFAAWASSKPAEIQDALMEVHGRSTWSRQRFMIRNREHVEREKKVKRRWAMVRSAVTVRPYALHWLEEHAKVQETERIARVAADPLYDPMESD